MLTACLQRVASSRLDKLRRVNPQTLAPPPDFAQALALHLDAPLSQVNAEIERALYSDVPLVQSVAHYIIGAGGKRMRPVLALLSFQAVATKSLTSIAISIAAIVELIHTATLLHDDVVDESTLRRGNATANVSFGNAASVLVGDFLYSRSFQLMVKTGEMRVLSVLSEATNVIAEGEVHQLMNAGRLDLSEAMYLHVVRAKTAKLFEAASRLGAMAGGASAEQEEALASYGAHLGTAFQIADDVLDYEGDADRTGKSLGDDLAEGKLTLPLIRALTCASVAQRAVLEHAIAVRSADRLSEVQSILLDLDAMGYARQAAMREAEIAKAAIALLPESEAKRFLLEFCAYAVNRHR